MHNNFSTFSSAWVNVLYIWEELERDRAALWKGQSHKNVYVTFTSTQAVENRTVILEPDTSWTSFSFACIYFYYAPVCGIILLWERTKISARQAQACVWLSDHCVSCNVNNGKRNKWAFYSSRGIHKSLRKCVEKLRLEYISRLWHSRENIV